MTIRAVGGVGGEGVEGAETPPSRRVQTTIVVKEETPRLSCLEQAKVGAEQLIMMLMPLLK